MGLYVWEISQKIKVFYELLSSIIIQLECPKVVDESWVLSSCFSFLFHLCWMEWFFFSLFHHHTQLELEEDISYELYSFFIIIQHTKEPCAQEWLERTSQLQPKGGVKGSFNGVNSLLIGTLFWACVYIMFICETFSHFSIDHKAEHTYFTNFHLVGKVLFLLVEKL